MPNSLNLRSIDIILIFWNFFVKILAFDPPWGNPMYECPQVLQLILKDCYKWFVLNVFCGHSVFQKGQNRHISNFFADFDWYFIIFELFWALIPPRGTKIIRFLCHSPLNFKVLLQGLVENLVLWIFCLIKVGKLMIMFKKVVIFRVFQHF